MILRTMGRKRRGSLICLGIDRWQIRVQRKGSKDISETIEASEAEARIHLDKLLKQLIEIEKHPERYITVEELLKEWLAFKKPDIEEKTFIDYENMFRRYVLPVLRDKLIIDVRRGDVQDLYNKMRSRGLSAQTVRKTHAPLKAAFGYAATILEYIDKNPLDGLKAPKRPRSDKAIPTPEELALILAKCRAFDGVRFTPELPLFLFALTTAARPEEYLALRWSDLDLDKATVTIRQALVEYPGGRFEFRPTKTEKSNRKLYLAPELVETLRKYRKQLLAHELRTKRKWYKLDLVFPSLAGTPMSNSNLNQMFKRLLTAANLAGKYSPYSLRHAASSYMLAGGVNIKVVSEILGHSSCRITLDTYCHVIEGQQKEAVETLTKFLRKTS